MKFSSIREPQVVRRPSVMITSLCASGMPVSVDAVPAAMRASAALAWTRAPSRSTVRNAFSVRFAASMRSSSAPVSSTLERRRACRARESSATEEVVTEDDQSTLTGTCENTGAASTRGACLTPRNASFDHFRDQIQPVLDRRSVALIEIPFVAMRVALGHAVLAQRQRHILRMRHRHDSGRIHRAHTLDQTENALELVSHIDGLGGGDFDPRQMGSALNVVDRKSHDQRKTVQKQG